MNVDEDQLSVSKGKYIRLCSPRMISASRLMFFSKYSSVENGDLDLHFYQYKSHSVHCFNLSSSNIESRNKDKDIFKVYIEGAVEKCP